MLLHLFRRMQSGIAASIQEETATRRISCTHTPNRRPLRMLLCRSART